MNEGELRFFLVISGNDEKCGDVLIVIVPKGLAFFGSTEGLYAGELYAGELYAGELYAGELDVESDLNALCVSTFLLQILLLTIFFLSILLLTILLLIVEQ